MPGASLAGSRIFGTIALVCASAAQSADAPLADELTLQQQIVEQSMRLEQLKRQIAETDAKLYEIKRALDKNKLRDVRATGSSQPQGSEQQGFYLAQASQAKPEPVGQQDESRSRPQQVAQIFEQPGVLTPRGKMVLDPGLQYGYSSSNRVSLVGYTIIPSLLIGLIDIREVKRNTITPSLTARWGITNRFELEAKLPYVYRSDSVVQRKLFEGVARDQAFSSTGHGIGDIEFTGRYQLNDGGAENPYYIATLRLKSRTGKDPFEVETDVVAPPNISNELQKELPTGSGFYTIQPGLTLLYPADPAVFFGSISYQHNIKRSNVSMNTTNGPVHIGDISPGGVFGFNFGMGLALNDRSSFSIGYDHSSVGKTKINGSTGLNAVTTQLGTLLIGYSHRINKTTSLNVSLGAGVTRDTPDVQLSVRLPMTF
jgi:hypothetical protein